MTEYSPGSLSEFASMAKGNQLLSVTREFLGDTLTPIVVYSTLVGDEEGFLLESVEQGEKLSRFSFVGRRPLGWITSKDSTVAVSGGILHEGSADQLLSVLESVLTRTNIAGGAEDSPLSAGLVGYIGYDVVREIEHLPNVPPDDLDFPDAELAMIGELVIFDHWKQRITLVSNVIIEGLEKLGELERVFEGAKASIDAMADELSHPHTLGLSPQVDLDSPALIPSRGTSPKDFYGAVEAAKEYIMAGDIFQVVLSQRFDFDLECSAFNLYRVLRQMNPSPYMYFVKTPSLTVVGSSPEALVHLKGSHVVTRPIAGTRRRGHTEEEDRRLAAELLEHPKEIAEHIMLVDLARNDLGRIAEFGTEKVDELMTLEYFSHVMHMTSQVSAEIKVGLGPLDVLRATLPAGTVSGAPKVRAMEIIDDLETSKRGLYAGVVGYFDFHGNLDLAIAIRTVVIGASGKAYLRAGGGVVADSDPELEDMECQNKAKVILAAAAAASKITGQSLV